MLIRTAVVRILPILGIGLACALFVGWVFVGLVFAEIFLPSHVVQTSSTSTAELPGWTTAQVFSTTIIALGGTFATAFVAWVVYDTWLCTWKDRLAS